MKMKGGRASVTLLIVFTLSWNLLGVESRPTDEQQEEDDFPEYDVISKQANASDSEETNEGFWANRRPCKCKNSGCSCCIGALFPLPILRQRACMNLTYLGDPSTMNMSISFNRRVLFKNITSAANPQPICASPPLFPRAEICVQLEKVFIRDNNMHACVKIEGHYNERVMFGRTMGCMYMGANGIAILRPASDGEIPGLEPGDNRPEDNKPDNNRPDNSSPDNSRPDNSSPDNNRPDNNRPADSRPDDSRPEDSRPDDSRPEDSRPDDSRPEDSRPDDSRPSDNTPTDNGPTDNTPDDEVNDPLVEDKEVNNTGIEENQEPGAGDSEAEGTGTQKKTRTFPVFL